MGDLLSKIRLAGWVVHALAAVVLVILVVNTGVMAGFCVVAGLLIGAAGVPTMPGRPIALYAAFGALMGYAFWMFVSALNLGNYLTLVPALLVVAGAAWLLRDPGWPPAIFTGVVVLACLGLNAVIYANRFDVEDVDSADIVRSVATSTVVLLVGLVYGALGLAEAMILKAQRAKAKAKTRRAIRTPTELPDL
ncbi:MAG TPA: hypothetical protein VG406_15575 [Isosphaeraceae bacterium]|jgi:hypothetical protein|nr:hypothetical protein [Isosphaeraceae bacterium]